MEVFFLQSGNFGPERNTGTCLVGEECGNLWRVRRDVGTSWRVRWNKGAGRAVRNEDPRSGEQVEIRELAGLGKNTETFGGWGGMSELPVKAGRIRVLGRFGRQGCWFCFGAYVKFCHRLCVWRCCEFFILIHVVFSWKQSFRWREERWKSF